MKYQRYIHAVLIIATLLALLLTTGITHAQEAAVLIEKKVILAQDGSAAQVTLEASCPAGMEVLEAFVYINQDGNETNFGGFNPPCDGQVHTTVANVNAFPESLLIKGKATASAFMLLIDPVTQSTIQAQDNRPVKLKLEH